MQLVSDGPHCETALSLPHLGGRNCSHLLLVALVGVPEHPLRCLSITIEVSGDRVLISHVGL